MTDQWEVQPVSFPTGHAICAPGWEPFAVADGWLWLRRRVEPVTVGRGQPRARVMTAKEAAALEIARRGLSAIRTDPPIPDGVLSDDERKVMGRR